jgi:hypothetical protein
MPSSSMLCALSLSLRAYSSAAAMGVSVGSLIQSQVMRLERRRIAKVTMDPIAPPINFLLVTPQVCPPHP